MDTPGGEITAIFGGKRGRDVVRAGGRSNRGVDVSTTGRLAGGLPEMKAIDPSRPGAGLVRARHSESVLRASIRSAAVMGVALRQSAGSPPRLELTGRKQRGRLESSC